VPAKSEASNEVIVAGVASQEPKHGLTSRETALAATMVRLDDGRVILLFKKYNYKYKLSL